MKIAMKFCLPHNSNNIYFDRYECVGGIETLLELWGVQYRALESLGSVQSALVGGAPVAPVARGARADPHA